MSAHLLRHKKLLALLPVFILLIAISVFLYRSLSVPAIQKDDYTRISAETYDTVFLSMFPTDHYAEEDYAHYRGQYTLKTAYCIPDESVLEAYLKRIAGSGNEISTIYLGILPESIAPGRLLSLLQQYPSVSYHVILPYPSMDYWMGLTDSELQSTLSKYRETADTLISEDNISLYLFSREWLICNPANYCDTFLVNQEISQTLMLNCDRDHGYLLTPENAGERLDSFAQLVEDMRTAPTAYPDLAGCKIVFFGDSVIGNFTDSASIPGVVQGLTGAAVYNCGYGGNSAAFHPDTGMGLAGIVDAFIAGDTASLPTDTQVSAGVSRYLEDATSDGQLFFVINYGLNDYFLGYPVEGEDPYDISTYSGAIRTAVSSLQTAYPDCRILLMTPNFTSYNSNGSERMGENGGTMRDYADAVLSIAQELQTDVLDNYRELGINRSNHGAYLLDGCHPNEATRFTIGRRISLSFD